MKTFPIIEKMGGRKALARKLKRPHGVRREVTTVAIGLWVHRGRIPGFAVVQMMELAARDGLAVQPSDFVRCDKVRENPHANRT